MLGVGPQGLGGDSTAFAVHVETAATHITMNPVAVNMQCHSARRARATFRPRRESNTVFRWIFLLFALPIHAAELEGVTVEDRVRVDGRELAAEWHRHAHACSSSTCTSAASTSEDKVAERAGGDRRAGRKAHQCS